MAKAPRVQRAHVLGPIPTCGPTAEGHRRRRRPAILRALSTSLWRSQRVGPEKISMKSGCSSGQIVTLIMNAVNSRRYAEIALTGTDRKERVSESTRPITIGSSCAFSAQTLASMSSGA